MPGNRTVFEAAMKRAAEHAWNQRWDLALAEYRRASEEYPDDMAVRGNLALAYYRLGNWESALTHYSWMLEGAPENAFIMDRLIEVYLKLERRSDAKRIQERLEAMNQKLRPGTAQLGAESAKASAERPSAPQPPAGTAGLTAFELDEMVALAMAYEESGKVADAIRQYEQALAAGLDRADANYSLGLLYQQQNRHEQAIARFAACLDDADYAMSATFATGVSHRALGRRDEAARMLSLAISLIDHDQIGGGEVDELITIYRTAVDALADISNYLQASNLASSLSDFLATRDGYQSRVLEYRALSQQLQAHLTNELKKAAATTDDSRTPSPPVGGLTARVGMPPTGSLEPPRTQLDTIQQPTPTQPDPIAAPSPALNMSRPAARGGRGIPATGASAAPEAAPTRRPTRRLTVAPVADEETAERLSSTYRRVTGELGQEPRRRITGDLPGETRGLTGTIGPMGTAGGESTLLSRTTTLLTERTPTTVAPARRRHLHALSGPLHTIAACPSDVQALAAQVEADAAANATLAALDGCYAMATLAPDYLPVHLRLAELYAIRGNIGLALDVTQAALRLLECREAPAIEQVPFLRLMVRLRPTDETALSAYADAVFQAGLSATATPLVRRLVRRLVKRGATSRALTEAERLAVAQPDAVAAILPHADTLTLVGQVEAALERYRKVLAESPTHIGAIAGANTALALLEQDALWWSSLHSLLGACQAAGSRASVPLHLFRRLAASAAGLKFQATAGLMLFAAGRPAAARAWLEPLENNPALDARLRVLVRQAGALDARAHGQFAKERQHYQAILGELGDARVAEAVAAITTFNQPLTPSCVAAELADLLARHGDLPAAIQALESVRKTLPGNDVILNRLSELYLKGGKLGAALAALDELATHLRDAGQLDHMAAVLDRMSQLAPNNISVKTKLIEAYLERGFLDQARRELELRAQLQATNGQLAGAITSLQRAADMCWTLGRPDDAYALCERMIALQPTNGDSRQYLITLFLQAGLVKRAVEQIWALATMHSGDGNHRDAIAAFHQIIGLDPDDTQAHHRLGDTLVSIGEYAQAERVYRRLMRQWPDDPIARARHRAVATMLGDATHDAA
jgi:tetratricopeptide (TPR) repeat protein